MLFQSVKGLAQSTVSTFLHVVDDQLVIAAGLVKTNLGLGQDLTSVLGSKAESALLGPEHCAANLGLIVFQREVDVS